MCWFPARWYWRGEQSQNSISQFLGRGQEHSNAEIEETFRGFLKRGDIDIILINQNVAEGIRHLIDAHQEPVPSVLEIPSKDHPYDPSKDSILRRAQRDVFWRRFQIKSNIPWMKFCLCDDCCNCNQDSIYLINKS